MAGVVQQVGSPVAAGPAVATPAAVQRRGRANLSLALKTPGQLRALLVASVVVSLIWGAVATWTAVQRVSAANAVVASSGPLSYDSQQAYQSLSDADATEAGAYLSGTESAAAGTRVHDDIRRAEADLLAVRAADSNPAVQADLTTLATQIPIYADYVGEADAFNRENQLVGAAWLEDASNLMRGTLLVAAGDLYQKENARLSSAYGQATGFPFLAAGGAILIAIAAFLAQRWLARRTNRVLNRGLVAACLIGLLSLMWLLASFAVARSDLLAGRDQGSTPAQDLVRAEITALQMHADESLTLINRGGQADPNETEFESKLSPILSRQLVTAQSAGAHSPGAGQAAAAAHAAQAWFNEHKQVRAADNGGNYQDAVTLSTGDSTAAFMTMERALTTGITADQAASASSAASGDGALGGLAAGMVIAALLMAAAGAWGVIQRIAEYR